MAYVTKDLIAVWESGSYVGENTPTAVVQVQLGRWIRGWYQPDNNTDGNGRRIPRVKAEIWGEGGYGGSDPQPGHWSAKWIPTTPFYDVPNLSQVKRTKDLTGAKGVQVLEVVLDAVDYVPKEGALGDAYHAIAPGWLAPDRNYRPASRPVQDWQQPDQLGEWAPEGEASRITDGVSIRVWQGYGQPETDEDGNCPPVDGGSKGTWTFRGMIDDVDLDGNPNTITITARNGKLLTDQRVFRAAKSVQLKDPITFYDREAARKRAPVASGAKASSADPDHPARNVLDRAHADYNANDPKYKTTWQSAANIDDSHLEWVQIRLPQGNYDQFFMVSKLGQLAYVGIYAKPIEHWERGEAASDSELVRSTSPPTMDGEEIPEGWVDLGHGNPPGADWPYVEAFNTGSTQPDLERGADGRVIDNPIFQNTFELGKHSILRVGFVKRSGAAAPAVVSALYGMRRYAVQKDVKKQQFILVDDATEIVKVVLRWAGFYQWEIEDAMVRLSDGTNYGPGVVAKSSGRLTFNRANYLSDIIEALAKELGWVFFIADPTDSHSWGVPTFRRDASLVEPNPVAAIDESRTLTGIKRKMTDEERPFIIRVRGKTASARGGGVPLGGDSQRRLMAVYLPPWAFGSRSGGVLRHVVEQEDQLVTYAQCLYGAFLIALNSAVAMHTAVVEIPSHPLLELDDQVSVVDEPTAINSRLWITKIDETMVLGQQASWKSSLEGSLLDTEDLQSVLDQVDGKAPVHLGDGHGHTILRHRIDWDHVVNPDTGHVSRYPPPTEKKTTTYRLR